MGSRGQSSQKIFEAKPFPCQGNAHLEKEGTTKDDTFALLLKRTGV